MYSGSTTTVAKQHRDQHSRIKKMIRDSYIYWKPNVKRYNTFRKSVFDTAITEDQRTLLLTIGKPPIEFNIGEMFISRLRGEFSKQEPTIVVSPDDGAPVNEQLLKVVQGHLKHALYEANMNNCAYDVYTDLLSGGFSVLKIWVEYAHEMSFNQVIKFGRVYDPVLCGFDPLARHSHKGDGRFCYEYYPQSLEKFKQDYPHYNTDKFSFYKVEEEDFNWSYKNQQEEVVVLCDFYEKKYKKKKIVKLADGQVMTMEAYKKMLDDWKYSGRIEQPPIIVGKPRMTKIEVICRYRMVENDILEYVETDFKYLPLIFVDGNSIIIRDTSTNQVQQMTRPYIYHCQGAQSLKNFAGQTLAAYLENLVMHKFKVAKESIPDEEDYREAYGNMQVASTFVYNAFMDNDPDKAIPPPQEIQMVGAPPEIAATFQMMDQLYQTILGSFDAALGINDNQLSGVAIVEGATQSNAASMPYVVGFMQAWTQLGKLYVDLLPKYYSTPRTIPVMAMDGKVTNQPINNPKQQGSVDFNYDSNTLQVKVAAGPSFAIQKTRALNQLIALEKVSPMFEQFMSTEGLDILLDNVDFQGAEIVKERALKWQEMIKQQQQKAAQQPNPQQIEAQVKAQQVQIKQQELQLKAQELELKKMEMLVKAKIDMKKADTELKSHELDAYTSIHDAHLKTHDMHHKHFHETASLLHEIKSVEQTHELDKETARAKKTKESS